ncbi:MAG: hypothetical protein AAB116_09955 [Candidatus Poribacteria bacterium]|mgnify:CR=1 FL=1
MNAHFFSRAFRIRKLLLPIAGSIVFFSVLWIYLKNASFWVDEANVAVNFIDSRLSDLFAPLLKQQPQFPRFVLCFIWVLREIFGYSTLILRLIPLLACAVATSFWVILLQKRAKNSLSSTLIAAGLFINAAYFIKYGSQLKSYPSDVMFALIPFLLSDEFFNISLERRKRLGSLLLLSIPILFSYVYPIALFSRLCGWFFARVRIHKKIKLDIYSFSIFLFVLLLSLWILWAVDLGHHTKQDECHFLFWRSCALKYRFVDDGIIATFRLLFDFLFGWHANYPKSLRVCVILLEVLGVCAVIKAAWLGKGIGSNWGSRSLGSLFMLATTIILSTVYIYPICSGRMTLFTQVHTHLLILEGVVFLAMLTRIPRPVRQAKQWFLLIFGVLIVTFSLKTPISVAIIEKPISNLKAMIPVIQKDVANVLYVSICIHQEVDALPEKIPISRIAAVPARYEDFPKGVPVYILWSPSDNPCAPEDIEVIKMRAKSWRPVYLEPHRELSVAIF